MTNSQRLAEVRQCLRDWLAKRSAEAAHEAAQIVAESMLIVDGFYSGRRFDAGRYFAVWFIEEDELKIHASAGDLLCVYVGNEVRYQHIDEERADVIPLSTAAGTKLRQDVDSTDEEDIRRAA